MPFPERGYLRFRLEAMYAKGPARLEGAHAIAYLEWCRRMRAIVR